MQLNSKLRLSRLLRVAIKKNADNVKFKVCHLRFLYILKITDKENAEKLKQSLPPHQACRTRI